MPAVYDKLRSPELLLPTKNFDIHPDGSLKLIKRIVNPKYSHDVSFKPSKGIDLYSAIQKVANSKNLGCVVDPLSPHIYDQCVWALWKPKGYYPDSGDSRSLNVGYIYHGVIPNDKQIIMNNQGLVIGLGKTQRKIKAGEEVFIFYVDVPNFVNARNATKEDFKGFVFSGNELYALVKEFNAIQKKKPGNNPNLTLAQFIRDFILVRKPEIVL